MPFNGAGGNTIVEKMIANIILDFLFIKSRMSMPAMSYKKYDGKPIDAS